ncbi:MGDG synthase family glycosyltransferase [Ruminiclostridium cellobioparum]|uniref:UDP-N-acetylglucosamine:LPS N-acetylglucosamine transferase n=1 Tax=Ruminiclostridium cellobioparum subsp. termitidis CT1112 TaxID=1195236 RepID=S0FXR9_RUMCE|nr:glycosyltransferase [Ruminiclostridium cellobioparum]EMS73909.1 UDP-N-acetylglucosamine:LPS N-acetylglucosamine transferase [Ruminiclostridium cellobioparum subsp. termitidis CT1112]
MKNVVIISSDYTGHGHKSISESLLEQFNQYDDVNVNIIDGFDLGGNMWVKVGKSYGLVTRNAKELWKLAWKISKRNPTFIHEFTELTIRENFIKMLRKLKPDLILSVHPIFNSPILNILREYKINIPFAIFVADLVSISPLWADKRADCIICPTEEARERCIGFGVPESSIRVIGFPVRSRFTQHISQGGQKPDYSLDRPLDCLIMSGGEGSGDMSAVSKLLLDNFNCNVQIIAGRNEAMKEKLERTLSLQYPGRVEVHGYVTNIQDYMLKSDIAFTRGSPNVMMEAIACNVPLIITGALPGQEQENPDFAVNNKLGIFCEELSNLSSVVSDLLADNAKGLNEIKQAQREYFDHDSAKKIVETCLGLIRSEVFIFPSEMRRRRRFLKLKLQSRRSS